MSLNDCSKKLDPNLYRYAADLVSSGYCGGVELALQTAAYRLYGRDEFKLEDLIRHKYAWKDEHERNPTLLLVMNDAGMNLEKKVNSLLRMAYLAEKENE